jgi:hypothetical protein
LVNGLGDDGISEVRKRPLHAVGEGLGLGEFPVKLQTAAIEASHEGLAGGIPTVLEIPYVTFVVAGVLGGKRGYGGRTVKEAASAMSERASGRREMRRRSL